MSSLFSLSIVNLNFFTQFHAKQLILVGASRHLQLFSRNFVLEIEKFRRFAPFKILLPMSALKNRKEMGMFLFEEGEKLELLAKIFTLRVVDVAQIPKFARFSPHFIIWLAFSYSHKGMQYMAYKIWHIVFCKKK